MDADFPEGFLANVTKFFESESSRKPGQNLYPEVFETELFFPLQRQRELARMMQIARSKNPVTVMEIGADKGGGLYHWCKCLPTVRNVIACEIRGLPYRTLFEAAFPHIRFLWLEESSHASQCVKKVREWVGALAVRSDHPDQDLIDCLFIDGDKGAFMADFYAYGPMMRSDGIVFMHDINDRPPKTAYELVLRKERLRHEEVIDIADSLEAVDRENRGVPSTGAHEGWLRHWKGASAGVGVIYLGEKS